MRWQKCAPAASASHGATNLRSALYFRRPGLPVAGSGPEATVVLGALGHKHVEVEDFLVANDLAPVHGAARHYHQTTGAYHRLFVVVTNMKQDFSGENKDDLLVRVLVWAGLMAGRQAMQR